ASNAAGSTGVPAGGTGSCSWMGSYWSHIRYALTHRPPIVFDSLVKQFWATATVRTHEAGPSEIITTIDGNETTDPSPRPTFNFTAKLFSNMKLNWDGPHMPLLAPMLVVPAGGDGADAAAAGPSTAAQDTPVRDPTLVKEPTPSPMREPTTLRETNPEPPRPPSPPPCTRSEEVGPTTSTAGNDSISIEDPLRPVEPWPTSLTTPFNTTTSTRPPSPTRQTSFQEDINEGGGDYVSSPKSNEAPPSTAATAADGAEDSAALTDLSLKLDRCINRVTTLKNELGVTKKVFGGAILKLVSRVKRLEGLLQQRKRRMVLFDSEGEEAATKEKDIDLDALHKLVSTSLGDAGHDEDVVPDDTTMSFRHAISAGAGIPADAQTIHAGSTPIPTTGGVSAGSSMDPAGQAVAAAPSSSAIPVADKGKAPMVDDSIPTDLLTEQERVLKNLHDYQLGEDLTKKLQAEQEAEFARQQEELAQKAQAKSVASPAAQGTGLSAQRRRELDAAQLIYTEADWPKPTLEAPSAKKARQGVPLAVHAASSQVPAALSIAAVAEDPTTPTQVPPVTPDLADVAAHVDTEVDANEPRPDDNKTASEQVSIKHTIDETTPSSSRKRRKQLAKKRVTPIVDVADDALIKFDSASESDDDPSPYAPYASWEMVPTPFGSIHTYYDMEEHTKHFTSLRELLHMVEKNDLRRLLGDVDNFLLDTVDGRVIYMFVDVSYPLSEATLKRMPQHGLEVPKLLVRGDLTMAEQLGRIVGNYKISLRVVSAVSYSSCWQALQTTIEFEEELAEKFGGSGSSRNVTDAFVKTHKSESNDQIFIVLLVVGITLNKQTFCCQDKDIAVPEVGFNFYGIISSCFEPHLMVYVEFEDKTLMDNLDKLINEETWEPLVRDDSMTTHPLTRVRVNETLLHSRTTTSDVGEGDQANISNDSHVEEMEKFHAVISTHVVNLRAFEEDVASPTELAKAYMDASTRTAKVSPSTLRHGIQAPRQDSVLLNNTTIHPRTHVTSLVPRTAGSLKGDENAMHSSLAGKRPGMALCCSGYID
nr:membrane trafficking VPS53 family protein [Tanacetum cinerariifolium]